MTGYDVLDAEDIEGMDKKGDYVPLSSDEKVRKSSLVNELSGSSLLLSFDNLNYIVDNNGSQKTILRNVSGYAKPGEVLCIMGPSGAGKTCLMNALAGRGLKGSLTGERKINGQVLNGTPPKSAFVCADEDSLYPTLTIEECLLFSACLRLPRHTSKALVYKYVCEAMLELELTGLKNTKVGSVGNGVSTGERRRVAIGVELVARKQILFLDEPTSGLDSSRALKIVEIMDNLAKRGRTIVTVLHQPRMRIFEMLHRVLLLSKKGTVAYFGPTSKVEEYFNKHLCVKPMNENIADYMLDILEDMGADHLKLSDFQIESSHTYNTTVSELIRESKAIVKGDGGNDADDLHINTTFFYQLFKCTQRAFLDRSRNYSVMMSIYITAIFIGCLGILFYPHMGLSYADFQNRVALLTMLPYATSLFCTTGFETQKLDRHVFELERSNFYYYPSAFLFGVSFADVLQLRVIPPLLTGLICYFPCGLQKNADKFGTFLIVLVLMNICGAGLCRCIGCVIKENGTATLVSSAMLLLYLLYCGFLVNPDTIPDYMEWLKDMSLFYWGCGLLYFSEINNLQFDILSANLTGDSFTAHLVTSKSLCNNIMYKKYPGLEYACGVKPTLVTQLACEISSVAIKKFPAANDSVGSLCETGLIDVTAPGSDLLEALSLSEQTFTKGVSVLAAMAVSYYILSTALAIAFHKKQR